MDFMKLRPDALKRGLENLHKLNPSSTDEPRPTFDDDDEVIFEWRAMTIPAVARLLPKVNALLGLKGGDELTMAQFLEAGTWPVSERDT